MTSPTSTQAPPAALATFTFEGDELHAVRLPDGDVGLVLRRACEVLGLHAHGQSARLARAREAGARWATTHTTCVVAADGKVRSMEVLPRRAVPLWAATIDVGHVREELRPKLAAYQDRAADALADAFLAPRPSAAPDVLPAAALPGRLAEDVRAALAAGDLPLARALVTALDVALRETPPRAAPRLVLTPGVWWLPALRVVLRDLPRVDATGRGVTVKELLARLYPGEGAPPDGFDDLRDALEVLAPGHRSAKHAARYVGNRLATVRGHVVDGAALDHAPVGAKGRVARWIVRAGAEVHS